MKNILIISTLGLLMSVSLYADIKIHPCKKKKNQEKELIEVNVNGQGYSFEVFFTNGKEHNNPSFAIWIETMDEEFIQELFVTKSVATGIFRFGDTSTGEWKSGEKKYKATLPYFFHKRTDSGIIPDQNHPIIDAYTGATPKNDFILKTKSNEKTNKKFRLIIEINQPWDSNNFWHNAKFPNEKEYKISCQPSLIYAVTIDPNNPMDEYTLNPIGHGHYAGLNGNLFTDLSTFTTALKIAKEVKVLIK